ncbi:MAG: hypothetical protein D6731_08795, partial [Planctomycetota bacterium]
PQGIPNSATVPPARPPLESPQASDDEALVGTLLRNRYRILSLCGRGGMGTVYKAEHTLMGRTVAIKVLNAELVRSEESVARFRREVMAMAQFRHPNVVQIFDAGTTASGRFYMAMEFVEGPSLAEVLSEHGPLPVPTFAEYFTQVLLGVREGHRRGIVHRDLKTDNIHVGSDDRGAPQIKIMDFGIAKVLGGDGEDPLSQSNVFVTTERVAVGTPQYMSPEQASGGAHVDLRSDLYSLGVVAFELLTGELPFEADSPVGYIGKHILDPPRSFAEANPKLPPMPEVEAFVLKALEKEPDQRYSDAEAMLDALEAAVPPEVAQRVREVRSGRSVSASHRILGRRPPEEASGEDAPSPAESSLPLKLLVALLGTAAVLGAILAAVLLFRRPNAAERLAALDPEVQRAVEDLDWDSAKAPLQALLAEVGEEEAAAVRERLASVEAAKRRAEQLVGLHERLQALADRVRGAETLAAAEEALRELEAARAEALALRERIEREGPRGCLAGAPQLPDLSALRAALEPLRAHAERREALELSRKLIAQDTLDALQGAIERLQRLQQSLPANGEEAATARRLLAEARVRKLLREAEHGERSGDFQGALASLRAAVKALRNAPEIGIPPASIQERIVALEGRQRQLASERARAELERLLDESKAFANRGRYEEALRALGEAEQTWKRLPGDARPTPAPQFAAHRQRLEALRASAASFAQLPPLPGEEAGRDAVEAALKARQAYLEGHPVAHRRAEVAHQVEALERRLAKLAEDTRSQAFAAAVAAVEEALAAGDLETARARLRKAEEQGKAAGLDLAPLAALSERVEARARLAARLAKDFVRVGRVWISKYEVSAGEFFAFCVDLADSGREDVPWPTHWKSKSQTRYHYPPESPIPGLSAMGYPAAGVTFLAAEAFCAWKSKQLGVKVRLPTEEEWVQAATGGRPQKYPWGDRWEEGLAVYKRDFPLPVRGPATEALGGESPLGLYHMAGNVAEWTQDVWVDDAGRDPTARVVKGGSFRSFDPQRELAVDAREKMGTNVRKQNWVGLRIVVDPS